MASSTATKDQQPALPFFFFLVMSSCCSLARSKTVTSLPGLQGPLPFHLETGYVGVEEETGAKLFYYFIPSEGSPASDPLLLWLTGGPRCSVLSSIAFEIGPLRFVVSKYNGSLPQLVYNPISWTKFASVIFLDSPVGSGFSYALTPEGYDVGDTSSSLQVYTFLQKWLADHPEYLANPFYVAGDSYGGKVVPVITQFIAEGLEEGRKPVINLKGYIAGNPITGQGMELNYRVPFGHGVGIISDQLYESALLHCNFSKDFYLNPPNNRCAGVVDAIKALYSEFNQGDISEPACVLSFPHIPDQKRSRILRAEEDDIRLRQRQDEPPLDCISYPWYLSYFWANDNATRDALGIKKGTKPEWIRCESDLPYQYDVASSIEYHRNVTARGYRALVYSGDNDPNVPFLSTQAWVYALGYAVTDDWRAWRIDKKAVGFTISYADRVTFATVKGAGHTAPETRTVECFEMARRWLAGSPL